MKHSGKQLGLVIAPLQLRCVNCFVYNNISSANLCIEVDLKFVIFSVMGQIFVRKVTLSQHHWHNLRQNVIHPDNLFSDHSGEHRNTAQENLYPKFDIRLFIWCGSVTWECGVYQCDMRLRCKSVWLDSLVCISVMWDWDVSQCDLIVWCVSVWCEIEM